MATLDQWARDKPSKLAYYSGFLRGRSHSLPTSFSQLYGLLISKATSLIALPLPLLSFLAIPFVGGSSTTFNLFLFVLTWSALVGSHDPLTIELGGTLLVRLACFLLPALGMLGFDCAVPGFSREIKAGGGKVSPLGLGRRKVLETVGVAVFNVLLAVGVQAGCEYLAIHVLHLRSLLRITALAPLPWTMAKDILKGLLVRGTLRYAIHRYLLHTYPTWLKTWHLQWQHSARQPFSLVAAYDHPFNHLLSQWLPTYLPACLFRSHVLEWHIFLAIASLEDLFVYSGYAVLPSAIVIPGMARRNEAHFRAVDSGGKRIGNFGQLGLMDLACGTSCKDEGGVLEDLKSEAEEHQLQQRVEEAVQSALAGMQGKQRKSGETGSAAVDRSDVQSEPRSAGDPEGEGNGVEGDEDVAIDQGDLDEPQGPVQRRSGRRNGRKA
ncbi:hypothetical protein LTR91_013463 [Friedmanniomyces endolithicus]|uniref:Fatty acid hydroxylase domain-containing protein n=1 Tax=Friedmanniomyces endolithicus TaxID=329885 RepID=A0AAN6KDG6_9PEZI|nr:hypothetical protein LTR38_007219 [Friedmanniomyces endolithicus]KAK0806136.1 hypothetical protein LTR75_007101 [Friedmanniomyces endolithicus]KAK0844628.1 hypothetical protein LTR03_007958 [Friedmanniomyces endolithicus]KAK0871699.1 hypothetical protein LTS02_001763 [Friedmanniomyces endolithicus]KAK0878865.1 hypothetical protein LTR87_007315 [Friedmanniomyces endolithicus]